LKDFGRDAGNVSFADIDRDFPGQGLVPLNCHRITSLTLFQKRVLEYLTREDAERAVKDLDGKDLRGRQVRVTLDEHVRHAIRSPLKLGLIISCLEQRGSADNYRRDDRRDDRPHRDERYYREERPPHRRDRSRSPPRRAEYDDRRPKSPPPRRDLDERRPAGYDDYRRGGVDDRRAPDYYYDRRRDETDRRRDNRRHEEKDDYEDRSRRHANGDGGWAR
jgi:arginine/serine-rich splicing factor 4/5/6